MANKSNVDKITEHIAMMFVAYGQGDDIDRQLLYVDDLKDFPADLIEAACRKVRYESKDNFLPSVGKIVDACQNLTNTATGNKQLSWVEAQAEIQAAVGKYGFYNKPKFSRPEIEQAVKAFGWTLFCTARADNMAFVWSQIKANYEKACQNKREEQVNRYVLKERQGGYLGYQEIADGGLLPISISFPKEFLECQKLAECQN